ncbi:PadR family transcriptional regulator [Natrinema caseinilyticum]|uniref:PadR family transcriptional regulator n=1 Tax=Natrinema caseinilyticum TaxID=2961570 RepID=UPI0020C3B184|nr:PadR family transcriptional regulator [Natrinema caseinilyticum]
MDSPTSNVDILYVIAGQDEPHGLAIEGEKGKLEEYYLNEIHHEQQYPNLDTVVNKELVEKGQLDRRTNYYAITDEGEQAIKDRREWVSQYID